MRIKSLPLSHALWLYGRIIKKDLDDKKFFRDQIKILSYMINPTLAKNIYNEDSGDNIVNNGYLEDLKKICGGKDLSAISSIIQGMQNGQ